MSTIVNLCNYVTGWSVKYKFYHLVSFAHFKSYSKNQGKGPFIIYWDHRVGKSMTGSWIFFTSVWRVLNFFLPRNEGCWIFFKILHHKFFEPFFILKKNQVRKEAEYNRNTIHIYNRKMGRLFYIATELFLFPIWLSQTLSNFSQWQLNCLANHFGTERERSVKYIYIYMCVCVCVLFLQYVNFWTIWNDL